MSNKENREVILRGKALAGFIFSEVPYDYLRIKDANKYADMILNGEDLAEVLKELPGDYPSDRENRLKFAIANARKIQDSSELAMVLDWLHPDYSSKFAYDHDYLIQNAHDLATVLTMIPISDRLKFANDHAGLINNSHELSYVSSKLPSEQRLQFVNAQANTIMNLEVDKILPGLERRDRFKFACDHFPNIKNGQLAAYLRVLHEEGLEFAKIYSDSIGDDEEFYMILHLLKNKQDFARIYFKEDVGLLLERLKRLDKTQASLKVAKITVNMIQDEDQLKKVLNELDEKTDLLPYALAWINESTTAESTQYKFAKKFLKKLTENEDDRRLFAKIWVSKIDKQNDFDKLVSRLPENLRGVFEDAWALKRSPVKAEIDAMSFVDQLKFNMLLKTFSQYDKSFTLSDFKQIKHGEDLVEYFKKHSIPLTFSFLREWARVQDSNDYDYKYWDNIEPVLCELPYSDRLRFVEDQKCMIDDIYPLAQLLYRALKPDDEEKQDGRYEFAKTHAKKITDANTLARVLALLPKKVRLEFALMHVDKIDSGYGIAEVASQLPEEERLIFVTRLKSKIQDLSQLNKVLKVLSGPDQNTLKLEFAKHQL